MLVVASGNSDKKHRIYHRCGCMYATRIKPAYRLEMNMEKAERKHYQPCKYCSGFRGDVKVHKKAFETWARKKNMQFTYREDTDTLYIQTEIGFWKLFMKEELGKYVLYHRNTYSAGMSFNEARVAAIVDFIGDYYIVDVGSSPEDSCVSLFAFGTLSTTRTKAGGNENYVWSDYWRYCRKSI